MSYLKKELQDATYRSIIGHIRKAADDGLMTVKIPLLSKDHAINLVEERLTVHPFPNDHDYHEFHTSTVSWKES